jgi:HlyD family secretion protein
MDIKRPDPHQQRRRRWIGMGAAGSVFALLTIVALAAANRPPAVDGSSIWTGTVAREEFVLDVAAAGTLVAPDVRTIANRSEAIVEQIRVLPGRAVDPADILVEMSSPMLEEQLADARLRLQAAEAEAVLARVELENRYFDSAAALANAEGEYASVRMEVDAHERLGEQTASSAIEVRRTRLRAETWLKRLEAERARHESFKEYRSARQHATDAQLTQSRELVARLARDVDDLHVKAGVRGVVQEINVVAGERVSPGKAIARVVNPENLIARVQVSERDAAFVRVGMRAGLNIGQSALRGDVQRVAPTVRDQLVEVDIALADASPDLRPDLSVTARIELARASDVLLVDRPVGLSDGLEEAHVFLVNDDGDGASRLPIRLGRRSSRQVEVLAGLEPGDVVILSDLGALRDAAAIRIR